LNACKVCIFFKDIPYTFASVNSIAGKLFEKGKTGYETGKGALSTFFCSKVIFTENYFY
jgi:hypothetical protein